MFQIKRIVVGGVVSIMLLLGGYWVYKLITNNPTPACSASQAIFIPTNGGNLHIGKIVRTQTLTTKHLLTLLGIPVPICANVTTLTVPSETNYIVALEKHWKILLRDSEKIIVVIAPPLKPILPVNFDSREIKDQTAGCPLINTDSVVNAMNKGISAKLEQIALSSDFVSKARNEGRPVIAKFVQEWVMKQDEYKHAAAYAVKVFYSDETITYY